MDLTGNLKKNYSYNSKNIIITQKVNKHPCKLAMYNVMHAKGGGCSSCRG